MPDVKGTTRAQTLFLRSFRKSPAGPPLDQWPSLAQFRRWLRKPGFRTALNSLRETLRFQADFHLALRAAQAIQRFPTQDSGLSAQDLERLLRLSHLRQRFPIDLKLDTPATFALRTEVNESQNALESIREERELLNDPHPDDQDQQEEEDDDADEDQDKQTLLQRLDEEERCLRERLNHLKSPTAPGTQ